MNLKYPYIFSLLLAIPATCGIQQIAYLQEHSPDLLAKKSWCRRFGGFRQSVAGNFCYILYLNPLTWSAAVEECRTKKGQLFKMESTLIGAMLLEDQEPHHAWAGAKESDGTFYWLDGTPVESDNWNTLSGAATVIKSWFQKRTLCMILKRSELFSKAFYSWEKEECSSKFPYICEHGPIPVYTKESIQVRPTVTDIITTQTSLPAASLVEEKPRRQSTCFKGIKQINMLFNPKLRDKPDALLNGTDKTLCARICTQEKCCKVFNHFPPETCAIYCDEKRAMNQGADSVVGSKVFIPYTC